MKFSLTTDQYTELMINSFMLESNRKQLEKNMNKLSNFLIDNIYNLTPEQIDYCDEMLIYLKELCNKISNTY